MSSPAVTQQDIIDKWKLCADRTTPEVMREEMELFAEEMKAAGATFHDMVRRKAQFIALWCAPNWKAAQAEFKSWTNKDWYEQRHKTLQHYYGRSLKAVFNGSMRNTSSDNTSTEPVNLPKGAVKVEENMPVFDDVADFQAYVKRRNGTQS